MDAWTIRYTETDGSRAELDPMPEDDAKTLLDGVHRYVDSGAVLVDLVAEAQDRLPLGSRVRHTTANLVGTVVTDADRNAPTNRTPRSERISHIVNTRFTAVYVRWDGGARSWYDAAFIEPVNAVRAETGTSG